MNTRLLGKTGYHVAEIGLGCWQLGGTDWGAIDDHSALAILNEAIDAGANFFDTADVYGGGRSEELIGRCLKQRSARVYVATKLGRGAMYPSNFTEDGIRAATEGSLRRLGVDALDLTQLHCVPASVLAQGDVFGWLDKLQRQGKIKAWGASVESMDEALVCVQQPGCATLQIIFNIFRQKPIKTLFHKARAHNVGIIARLPLASGLLGGRLHRGHAFDAKDHRSYNRDGQKFNVGETFAGLPFDVGLDVVAAIEDQLPRGVSLPMLALRWILDFDAVSVVIPGASKPGQAKANAAAASAKPLPTEMHDWLAQLYVQRVSPYIRGAY